MRALFATLLLGAALFVGACNSSSSSTAPSVAPVPTIESSQEAPSLEPSASPS